NLTLQQGSLLGRREGDGPAEPGRRKARALRASPEPRIPAGSLSSGLRNLERHGRIALGLAKDGREIEQRTACAMRVALFKEDRGRLVPGGRLPRPAPGGGREQTGTLVDGE